MPPVGSDPVAPLLPVVASGVAGKARARPPVFGERVAVPDANAERVQVVHIRASGEEPEKLGDDRPESEPLRRHRREARG